MKKYIMILLFAFLCGCSTPVVEEKEIIEEVKEKQIEEVEKEIEEKQEEKTEEIVEEPKIVYDRQERIDAYAKENPDLSEEECIKRVYMNLDIEPYSQTVIVEDLDSYTMLVNKYSGLPSDYTPADLVPVEGGGMVREKVAQAFNELAADCASFDLSVSSWSAYRS